MVTFHRASAGAVGAEHIQNPRPCSLQLASPSLVAALEDRASWGEDLLRALSMDLFWSYDRMIILIELFIFEY